MIRIGLLGTNTSHAGVFAGIINGVPGGASPLVAGARVTAVWSSGRVGLSGLHDDAATLARKYSIERIVDDPTELLGSIDAVVVVDDADGGALHPELAQPFLAAGLSTFIDKPMTLKVAEAVGLFDLAERHGAALMSCSALRFAKDVRTVIDADVGRLSSVVSVGPGDWYNYGVHAVEMACAVAGTGATWVHRFPSADRDVVVVGFDNGPSIVVETLRDAAYMFHLSAYGARGMAQTQVADADGFYAATMAAVVRMAETGTAPIRREDTLQVLGILAAGERSAVTGKRVSLDGLVQDND